MIQDLERKTEKVIIAGIHLYYIIIEAIFNIIIIILQACMIINFLCSLNIHVPTSAMDQC